MCSVLSLCHEIWMIIRYETVHYLSPIIIRPAAPLLTRLISVIIHYGRGIPRFRTRSPRCQAVKMARSVLNIERVKIPVIWRFSGLINWSWFCELREKRGGWGGGEVFGWGEGNSILLAGMEICCQHRSDRYCIRRSN